jgi:hypothetical protein
VCHAGRVLDIIAASGHGLQVANLRLARLGRGEAAEFCAAHVDAPLYEKAGVLGIPTYTHPGWLSTLRAWHGYAWDASNTWQRAFLIVHVRGPPATPP